MKELFSLIIILSATIFCSCKFKEKKDVLAEIKGTWYLNKWTSYHTLIFGDSTVFVDNNVDTVFTLNYFIANDSLITWSGQSNKKNSTRIISINKDTLVLDGIEGVTNKLDYSRIKKPY